MTTTREAGEAILAIEAVTKRFGGLRAVDDASFTVVRITGAGSVRHGNTMRTAWHPFDSTNNGAVDAVNDGNAVAVSNIDSARIWIEHDVIPAIRPPQRNDHCDMIIRRPSLRCGCDQIVGRQQHNGTKENRWYEPIH